MLVIDMEVEWPCLETHFLWPRQTMCMFMMWEHVRQINNWKLDRVMVSHQVGPYVVNKPPMKISYDTYQYMSAHQCRDNKSTKLCLEEGGLIGKSGSSQFVAKGSVL